MQQNMQCHLLLLFTCLWGAEASGYSEADTSLQGQLQRNGQEAAVQDKAAAMHDHKLVQERDCR